VIGPSKLALPKLILGAALIVAATQGAAARASEIVGRIVNAGGVPVAGETITLSPFRGASRVQVVTDATGRYAIENLKPGAYELWVRSQSAVAYVDGPGVTIDWGLSPGAPPVAVATRGISEAAEPQAPVSSPSSAAEGSRKTR
jgi:hypothetical protein